MDTTWVCAEVGSRIETLRRQADRYRTAARETHAEANKSEKAAADSDLLADQYEELLKRWTTVDEGSEVTTVWECEPPAMGETFRVIDDRWTLGEPLVRHICRWIPAAVVSHDD
jgi:hypothetical protein